ncbi:unnamed protein product, partial [Rotaria sp. Silwood2]
YTYHGITSQFESQSTIADNLATVNLNI